MNNYVETPDGQRLPLILAFEATPGRDSGDRRSHRSVQARIDRWYMPEPPESA